MREKVREGKDTVISEKEKERQMEKENGRKGYVENTRRKKVNTVECC